MGGKQPSTIMTKQSAAMAKAITIVFSAVSHRLCTWHIGENAKKGNKGFEKERRLHNTLQLCPQIHGHDSRVRALLEKVMPYAITLSQICIMFFWC